MTPQEIEKLFENAPEGATHYHPVNHYFYKYENGVLQSFMFDTWGESGLIKAYHVGLIARPSPSWSGEGLPPVGVDLQWFSSVYGWIGGKVVAHDEQTTIVRHNDGYEGCYLHNLKPCPTPEQIAADEREAAILQMLKDAGRPDTAKTRDQAQLLYDAGWRKQPKP